MAVMVLVTGITPVSAKNPKWFKAASNSVVQVVTYQNGRENGRSNGFFTAADGTCVSDYSIFVGADSAVTIANDGKARPVTIINGANNMYETIRFYVVPDKKLKTIAVTQVAVFEKDKVSVVPFQGNGKMPVIEADVESVSLIDGGKSYYKLELPYDSIYKGCPVVDESGSCIGVVQTGSAGDRYTYVLDVNYTLGLSPNATDLLDRCYTDLNIKRTLPTDEDQALAYVYYRNNLSTHEYRNLLDQFLEQFPNSPDGLFNYGAFILSEQSMESQKSDEKIREGESYIQKAIDLAEDKARFHCDYASLILENVTSTVKVYMSDDDQKNLEQALSEVDKALSIQNEPAYLRLKANILYTLKRYQEAFDCAEEINHTDQASAESYLFCYEISRKLNNPELSIELLDSVISKSPRPISQTVVALFLERGNLKDDIGRYREAVLDYLSFESAYIGSLPASYYYAREQIEIKAKMYEQALADIAKARELEPGEHSYTLENASLHLRVGQAEQALEIMKKLVEELPDDPDVQRITGISYMRCNDSSKACEHLHEALLLGDELVKPVIEQNCK